MKFISPKVLLVFFAISSVVFNSCIDCTNGEGEIFEESRILKPFEIIVVNGSADVIIHQNVRNKTENLIVKAQKNLIPYILTENSGSKLVIDTEGCIAPTKRIEIYVGFNNLSKIITNGSGDIRSENNLKLNDLKLVHSGSSDINMKVKGTNLEIVHEGSGRIRLDGKFDYADIYQAGSGDIKCFDLSVDRAEILNEGSGDIDITVNKEINAVAQGSGDITFQGSPEVRNVENNGSGTINSKE